jgi:hypothetical protein
MKADPIPELSQIAAEARQKANALTPEQREAAFAHGMSVIDATSPGSPEYSLALKISSLAARKPESLIAGEAAGWIKIYGDDRANTEKARADRFERLYNHFVNPDTVAHSIDDVTAREWELSDSWEREKKRADELAAQLSTVVMNRDTLQRERDAAWSMVHQYDQAHCDFDHDILALLQRCQNGEATCMFTAQVIEAEIKKLQDEQIETVRRYEGELAKSVRDQLSVLDLITQIREALGDDGKRMQDELIEYCRELAGRAQPTETNPRQISTSTEVSQQAEIQRLEQCCKLECERANNLGATVEQLRATLQQIHTEATAPLCASYEYDATPTAEERLRKIASYSAPQQ